MDGYQQGVTNGLIWVTGGVKYLQHVAANTDPYTVLLVLALCVAIAWAFKRDKRKNRKIARLERGGNMRPEQEFYEKAFIADGIEDIILTGEVTGKLTQERGNHYRRLFANILDNSDLLSKHNKTLKKMLKDKWRGPFRDPVVPLPIPEPAAVTTENNVIRAEGKFTSKYLQKKQAAVA